MKIWKILSGIFSLLLSAFTAFQLLSGSLMDPITTSGRAAVAAGTVSAVALAVSGGISIITRGGRRGGDIAMAILYGVGGVVGIVLAGEHMELRIFAVWSLLCMVMAMVDIGRNPTAREEEKVAVPLSTTPTVKRGPATLEDIVTEQDPKRRSAAIDALPDPVAKAYLKRTLNIYVDRHDDTEGDDSLVKTLIVVLAVVGLLIVTILAVGVLSSLNGKSAASSSPPAVTQAVSPSQSIQVPTEPDEESPGLDEVSSSPDEESPEPSPEDTQPRPASISGSGTLGDNYVEIKDAFLTNDYQGDPAVVVTYAWTNNSGETANALSRLNEQMFQNGVELSMATVTGSERYTSGSSLLDVRPGARAEVQCAFRLTSTTSPIEFEISEFLSSSGTVVYKSFDLATLEVEGSEEPEPEADI